MSLKNDSNFFIAYFKLGKIYLDKNPDKARFYFEKFLKYAKTSTLKKEVEEILKSINKKEGHHVSASKS